MKPKHKAPPGYWSVDIDPNTLRIEKGKYEGPVKVGDTVLSTLGVATVLKITQKNYLPRFRLKSHQDNSKAWKGRSKIYAKLVEWEKPAEGPRPE